MTENLVFTPQFVVLDYYFKRIYSDCWISGYHMIATALLFSNDLVKLGMQLFPQRCHKVVVTDVPLCHSIVKLNSFFTKCNYDT